MATKFLNNSFISRMSYKKLNNAGRYVATIAAVLFLALPQAWGATTYAQLITSVSPEGGGNAYCVLGETFSGTETSATGEGSKDCSSSFLGMCFGYTYKAVTFSIQATPKTGYKFNGWAIEKTNGDIDGSITAGLANATTTVSFKPKSTKESSPITVQATANFVKVFQFKAKADFTDGSAGGNVWVSFTDGTPAYQTTPMTDTSTQDGTTSTDANATKTVYFKAQAPTGTEFIGWYSDAAAAENTLVSRNPDYFEEITSSSNDSKDPKLLTLYAKFEKVPVDPYWTLAGVAGTEKTLEIGETIGLMTNTAGNPYAWGTPSYEDDGETEPVMDYDLVTKTFTANRAGTVTITFTQAAGDDGEILWRTAGEKTFTFTVEKHTPQFAWADPLPNFIVNTTLPVSSLFSFTPAESAQNWTLTSSDPTNLPSIAAPATDLSLPKEVNGVTLTFHQDATWEWKEIKETSIKINVTKEPVVFNWKNPSLIAGNTYSWTDFVETNSEGAWNLVSEDERIIPTMRSIASTSATVSAGKVTLTFTQGQDLAHDAVPVQTKTFTVYPADGLATYKVGTTGSTFTNDLAYALSEASKLSSNKYVFIARDGIVLPGTYNIPSGVTLVVPYEDTYQTAKITQPKEVANSTLPIEAYRTLTLVDGVTINVSGAIAVCAQVQSGDASHNPSGFPVGPVGVIDMSTGGKINVKSGGVLYAWGFIKGEGYLDGNNTTHVGSVTAESGSTIWECFGMGDWNGGSFAYAAGMNSKSYKIFPFQSYFVQNIEVPLHMKYGAQEKLFASFYGNSRTNNTTVTFISYGNNTALFLVTENSATSEVVKRYDPTTDHMVVDLVGNSKLGSLEISIGVSVSSSAFDLPIINNMHIRLIDCNLFLTSPVKMFPGSVFEVTKGSTLTISTNVYVIDHDDWDKVVNKHYFGVTPKILTPHVNLGDNIDENTLADAKIIVDGGVVISSGGIFTSPAGANVMGNGGGTFKWSGALPKNATTYGYTLGNSVNGSTFTSKLKEEGIVATVCNPAKLHNDAETTDDSYTASVGSKTFYNVHGRWFVQEDKDEKSSDHTYYFTYLNGGSTATTPAVYSSSKTELKGGYKWVNVELASFCGSTTYQGKDDGHYYYYNSASTDAVSKWVQLVKLNDALYSGSDNNLYTFTTNNCSWASVGEIDENCMYTVDGVKKALVGNEFVELKKDEYDEVYVNVGNHSDYYMLFDGCVWQHATKIPDTYRAYEVLGNPYIWLNDEWTQVAEEYGYYYTTDDQNIKHYYEFDNVTFSWRPVTNKVRITTDTEHRDFLNWDMAMLYLSQYTNPTVTLLADVATTSIFTITGSAKTTDITIDLNDHVLDANVGTQVTFLKLNNSKVTLTITDNSDRQRGELKVTCSVAKRVDAINVTAGNVVMEAGKVSIHNTSNSTSANASAIYAVAGQSVTVNGGELEAISTRSACGINAASSATLAAKSIITMKGGVINATATYGAYGILSYGIINMNGGTINATTTVVNGVAASNYAYGIYGHASANATEANAYRSTIKMTGGTINSYSAAANAYGVYAHAAVTTCTSAQDGSYSNKAAAHMDISGGTINVTAVGAYAYGVNPYGCFNSNTDHTEANQVPHTIKNVTINAKGNSNAYGILVSCAINDYNAAMTYGNVIIDSVNIHAETTGSTTAYGVYVSAAGLWLNRYRYYQIAAANRKTWYVPSGSNDGFGTFQIDGTVSNTYIYQIGNYTCGAKCVIHGGTFYAKSVSTTAAGVYVHGAPSHGDNSWGYGELTINGGTFTGETGTDTGYGILNYGNTTINGGTFSAITGTTTAYGAYAQTGTLNLKGGTYNATSNGSTAYGVYAGATINTSNTTRGHGTVNVYEGVVVNARSLTSSTVFGAYASASAQELTEAKYNARSASDRGQYCLVDAEGNLVNEALNATTNDGQKQNFYKYQIGQYFEGGIVNIHGGTFNATANTSTAAGVAAHMSNIVRTTEIGRHGTARGTVNVYNGTFNVECETSSTAMGVRSYGIVNVEGGTFNMTPKTTNAEGVRVYDGTTTINGGIFNINATTQTAYGLFTTPDWDTNYAFGYSGEIIVNGGTFNVKTYGGDAAYAAYSTGGTKNMKGASVTGDVAKDYAVAGSITINGGEFTMTPSTSKSAYAMVVTAPNVLNAAKAYPRGTINGGFFKMVGLAANSFATGADATEDGEGVPQLQVKGGHFSTKANLEQASPKNYVRDPYKVIECIHPDYKKDYPFEVAEVCTITFKDDKDNILWSGLQPKGTLAIYPLTNGVPEKAATSTNSYDFTGWDTPLATITGDATYTASFNTVPKKYMVTWQDENGNEIDHMEWSSGQTPTHADPVKEGYTFTGWTPAISAVASAPQTYKATFQINTYTIRFEDEDGTLLKEQVVNYGVKPTAPATPTKEGYSFSKWNPGVLVATEDITYTASYLLDIASVTTSEGTTKYSTFAAALKAANNAENSTLVLLQDQVGLGVQTITQSFTLDLNGHTLASASSKFITLSTAGKTLTIDDSQGGGRIELIANHSGEAYAVFINNGTVVLNNGTIHGENVHATAVDSRKGIGVRIETASGKFVMNGGRVEGQSKQIGTGIYAVGPVEVYGGEITGTARTKARAIYTKAASLIVKNAYLEATTTVSTGAYGIYSDTGMPVFTIDNVVIKATTATTDAYGINLYSGNQGTISNVKIQATTAPIDADATNALSITSGFFDKETNLANYIGTKKVVALTTEPEKAEGYNYKIVDNAHQVTFKNEDGSIVLQQSKIEDGVQPVYFGETQTKASTPKYAYSFDGWKDASDGNVYAEAELPAVIKDVVYTAHFAQSGVEYPITFANIDGLGTNHVQMVKYGEVPVYNGATPYMSGAVSNYAYSFIGWDPELAVVEGPATYTPRYDLVISHNVSFVINNASATTPTTLTVAEGAAVERPADQLIDCQHIAGWYKDAYLNEEWDFASDKMGDLDITLYAKWETKTYTITWLDETGNEIDRTIVDCGTVPSHADLYKTSTASFSYEWRGWNKTLVAANADATYKSLGFTQVPKRYAITFVTGPGATTINPIEQEVGTPVVAPSDPTREGYTFNGWIPAVPSVMPASDIECVAQWMPDRELDIVDWTSNSITINVTNLKAESGTNKNNWKICVNGTEYTRASCSTQSRTLTIDDLELTPNDNLLIQLKNDADVIESQHNYMIPQIYNTANATLSGTTSSSVVYVYGGKLTISDNTTLAALYVCPGAEVEVTDGNTLTVGKLVLRTKPWATAAISGNVTATNVYYTRIAPDGSVDYPTGQYYQFGLPYACAIKDVRLSDCTTPAYNTTWILKSYNEERRATNGVTATGENWDVLESTGTIAAGRGYEMFSSYKYYREYYFPVTPTNNTSVAVTRTGDDKNNSGWNIVCSPLMSVYKNESKNPADGLKVSWLLADGSYDQQWPEYIWPAMPFSYQASANGSLDFSTSEFNQTVSAPRRAAYKEDIQTEWIHVDVKDENGVGDHTSVFVHPDRFEATYQTGIDVAKQSLTASRAILYSSHAYGEMAFAGVADSLLERGVALTVYSPMAQELTFSLRDNNWLDRMESVWLIDKETGAMTDLLASDYSYEAAEGTTRGRFFIQGQFKAPNITTELEPTSDSSLKGREIRKVIINQKMFIEVNGRLYDATGKEIKR